MTYHSDSILAKHAGLTWFDDTYDNFEPRLEAGEFPLAAIKPWFLIRTYCMTCDGPCVAIRYHGRRILLIDVEGFWRPHQCPYEIGPEEGQTEPTAEEEIDAQERADIEQELVNQQYPDDPEVRDGDGNIRGGGWTDPGTQPRSFGEPVFGYPDIPYVDPTRGNHR